MAETRRGADTSGESRLDGDALRNAFADDIAKWLRVYASEEWKATDRPVVVLAHRLVRVTQKDEDDYGRERIAWHQDHNGEWHEGAP